MSGGDNGLIRAFLNHRIAANLVAVLLCLAGVLALTRLNTQFFPTVHIPSITVTVIWPGAGAMDISEGVLDIVEPELRFIDEVKDVTSYAIEGSVRIVLEFNEDADMDEALSEVEQRVANITTLPADAERPIITRARFYETVAQIAVSGPFDENVLQRSAKELRDRLLNAGIDRVAFTGKRDQEIWIELSDAALQQTGLTLRDVADRVALVSQNLPLGNLEGGAEKQLRARGRVTTADGIAAVELKTWENGAKLLIRDVAVVREAHDDAAVRVFHRGDPAVLLAVQRTASSDTLQSMNRAVAVTDAFRAAAPPTLSVEMFSVFARIVDQRIAMLTANAVQGFAIVCVVLLLFLNIRVAFWVAAGIPISLLATFALMYVTGQTINAVSLVALILVLGMIVDDAIVVGEHAYTRRRGGDAAATAAKTAANRMLIPILASTSTTQAAFLPILMIGGVMGQILSAIPMVVVAALAASVLECFLCLPSHLKHALADTEKPPSATGLRQRLTAAGTRFRERFDAGFERLRVGPMHRLVTRAVRWRYVTLALAVASLLLSFGLVAGGRVGFTFFPSPEPDTIYANITFAPGLPEQRMLDGLRRIEAAAVAAVDALPRPADEPHPIVIAHAVTGQQEMIRGANLGRVELELTPGESRSVRTDAVVAAWQAAMPPVAGVERVAVLGRRGGPPGSDVDVRITGAGVEELKQASLALQDRLQAFPGLVGIGDDLPFGKSEVLVKLNARGAALGFTTETLGRQVRAAYAGAVALRFPRGDEEVTIKVRSAERDAGLAGLRALALRTPSGGRALLADVADLEEQTSFSVLQRRDGQIAISVTADVIPEITGADAVLAVLRDEVLPDLQTRHDVRFAFHGRAEMQRDAFADLRLGTFMALGAIYLILAFAFERWLQPLLVMTVIPFGFVGAVLGHWIMDFNLTLFSFVGLLGLSGILVNGSIVLVDRMNERRKAGEELLTAAVHASGDRLRALLLTTLTTVGGVAPLMFEKSLQAQFLIPIAITLCFGLMAATLLILFLVPALIGVGHDIDELFRGRRAALLSINGVAAGLRNSG